ncbi:MULTISPECIES: NTP transferase domain-containing protein [unclassified Caballeronia]|uniref:NTP transferase domain-containing protein n=1 Tax=unclassified Caballeronia TaxID=2646786 RepID=UPI002027AE99|nr:MULTISPECIES: NTP transferase domain-containing protein [unclassified Caballeronia]
MSFVAHAVIAAAGLGSRLGRGHPKCLLDLKGATILERQLRLLDHIEDVRIVVGFEEQQVIDAARAIRPDIIIVRNPAYRSTTTLQSYALGAKGLTESCVFMDADIVFEPASFHAFLDACSGTDPLIAVTAAKTIDAVFTRLEGDRVMAFSRTESSDFEWANLCYLPPAFCETGAGAVYERISCLLPVRYQEIVSFEIDTPTDLEGALRGATFVE